MGRRVRVIAAGVVWLLSAALMSTALLFATHRSSTSDALGDQVPLVLASFAVVVAYASTGGILVVRQANRVVASLLSAVALLLATGAFGIEYAREALMVAPGSLPGGEVLAWAFSWTFVLGLILAGPALILLFPDGRLPSPRWRPVGALLVAGAVGQVAVLAFRPGLFDNFPVANPFGLQALAALREPLDLLVNGLVLAAIAGAAGAVVWRFGHADRIVRQQLKWFGFAGLIVIALLISTLAAPQDSTLGGLAFGLLLVSLVTLPIAVTIAVLRYRLYEIDTLISRTLVYVPLSALLAGLYAASVALFQRVFEALTGDRSDAAIVLSTLILASLFTPVRRWLEGMVERRFKPISASRLSRMELLAGDPDFDAHIEAIASAVVRRELATMKGRTPPPP